MGSLILASILWAFSFGLIKGQLAGHDPLTVAALRLALAAAVFAPWLRRGPGRSAERFRLAALGGLQFGLMYALYIASYETLPAYAVALFTVLTPIYVALIHAALEAQWNGRTFAAALMAVMGASLITFQALPGSAAWRGVLLLQGANLCFALGQVLYARRRAADNRPASDAGALAWMYVGGAVLVATGAVLGGLDSWDSWTAEARLTILYLGLVPTALGFWLWNRGVARVSGGVAAVMNNLKIPLAIIIAWGVFGEALDPGRLGPGLALIVAAVVWLSIPNRTN